MKHLGPPRRTQAERSAETRAALLRAAVSSLVEVGYAHTTTAEVAKRAGVSRGAQSHHFATKEDLVVGAIEHVFAEREAGFVSAFETLPPEKRTLTQAVELLGDIFRGEGYVAMMELAVAGRTDPALRMVIHAVSARFEETVRALFRVHFPHMAEEPLAPNILSFAFVTLQGLALANISGFFGEPEETLSTLRLLAAGIDTGGLSAFGVLGIPAVPGQDNGVQADTTLFKGPTHDIDA